MTDYICNWYSEYINRLETGHDLKDYNTDCGRKCKMNLRDVSSFSFCPFCGGKINDVRCPF